jgi:tetratricopeptide (TPR) repeat protein
MSIKINVGFVLATLIFALILPHAAHAESRYTLQNRLASHERKGNEYMRQRQFALAESEFDQVIRYMHKLKRKCRGIFKSCYIKDKKAFYKLFARPYTNRGICRFGQKNFRGARSDANTALGWNKNYTGAHMLLGLTAYAQNNMREARKHYEMVLRLNSTLAATMLRAMPKLR